MNVLVTGGSGGLGEAIVRRLAARANTRVHFTYRARVEAAERITAECSAATAWRCDFADPAAVAADRQGIRSSIVGRMHRHGGSAAVRSNVTGTGGIAGGGTEVRLRMPLTSPSEADQPHRIAYKKLVRA